MERLRGVLASSGTGDRVLELLEQLRETQAEQLAEAICSVLEARRIFHFREHSIDTLFVRDAKSDADAERGVRCIE